MSDARSLEPYRVLFPLGLLSGIFGVALWLAFQHQMILSFPRQAHANIMFFAFLWAFVAGFLMTAIPKMTGAGFATKYEILVAVILVCMQNLFSFLNYGLISVFVLCAQTGFLIVFIVRRFLLKRRIPFEGFFFVPFAFAMTASGIFTFFLTNGVRNDVLYLLAGEAFILNLVMGLGSRLIPVITRIPNAVMPDQAAGTQNKVIFLILAFGLNIGFLLQAFLHPMAGVLIRFAIVSYVVIRFFKLFSKSLDGGWLPITLKFAAALLPISYFVSIVLRDVSFATQHLLYIGGFVLVTLMIGTRVMLAHGGQDLGYEIKSKRIAAVGGILILTSIIRFFAGQNYLGSAMTAAISLFILAILVWGHKFLWILGQNKR